MDYLDHQRYIPKYASVKKEDVDTLIEKKRCKTCRHYDLYFCRALNISVAPDIECKSALLYIPNDFYKILIKVQDTEEEASV